MCGCDVAGVLDYHPFTFVDRFESISFARCPHLFLLFGTFSYHDVYGCTRWVEAGQSIEHFP